MKHAPTALLFAALVATDQTLKAVLPTPYWGWDQRGFSLHPLWGLAAVSLLVAYKPTRLGGTIMAAGLAGNVLSALHGPVANPFVVGDVAFNLADCMLLAGFCVLLASVPAVFRCQQEFGRKRGWTW